MTAAAATTTDRSAIRLAHASHRRHLGRWIADALLVWAIFAAHAAWPVPDVNEPHYLGKARHYWQPELLAGDFFLESAETHHVFYLTVGWLAEFLPLWWFAWCGRMLAWALAAAGWTSLCRALVPRQWIAPLTAGLFVGLNTYFQMAGEWVIGGLEAKSLAYGIVFFALAAILKCRWNLAWILLGAATAMHVLAGGWAAVCAAYVWWREPQRPLLTTMLPGLLIGAAVALAGLVPAVALTWNVDASTLREANDIYVFRRLRHHLIPAGFDGWAVTRFVALLLVWIVLGQFRPTGAARRRLRMLVTASLLIALVGWVISWTAGPFPELAARLLRYYWFRTADWILPLGVALEMGALLAWRLARRPARQRRWLVALALVVVAHLTAVEIERRMTGRPRADDPKKIAHYDDWRDVCDWIAEHTPRGTVFLTPRHAQTFRWYAERPEVVTWKDIPQSPHGIVEWWRRLHDLHTYEEDGRMRWYRSLAEREPADLRELAERYGANYLVTEAQPELALPRVYQNNSYAVYQLSR